MNKFTTHFDDYALPYETISTDVGEFTITARIERDDDTGIDDDDYHNPDRDITGLSVGRHRSMMTRRKAWFNNEWFYCGIVLSVSKAGIELDDHAASLWGIECNYPLKNSNKYLMEVSNQLLPDAVESGRTILKTLTD